MLFYDSPWCGELCGITAFILLVIVFGAFLIWNARVSTCTSGVFILEGSGSGCMLAQPTFRGAASQPRTASEKKKEQSKVKR